MFTGGGALPFIPSGVGPVVLGVLVVGAFVLYAWYGGPDPSGRRTHGAYVLTVVLAGVLVALWAFAGLATAAAEAITDRPSGVVCAGGDLEPLAQGPATPAPPPPFEGPTFPPFEGPTFPPFERPEPEPFEPPEPLVPELPEVSPFPIPSPFGVEEGLSCEPGAGRERAPGDAARSGILLVVAGGLIGTHAGRARRLLEKEEGDG